MDKLWGKKQALGGLGNSMQVKKVKACSLQVTRTVACFIKLIITEKVFQNYRIAETLIIVN